MTDIKQIRQQYPQYDDVSDGDLLLGLHRAHYPDMHVKDFMAKVDPQDNARFSISDKMWPYWEGEVTKKRQGESQSDMERRAYGAAAREEVPVSEGIGRSALQGLSLGIGDEAVAAMAATAHPFVKGSDGSDWGDRYDGYLGRERGKIGQFREERPATAYGTEIAASIVNPATMAAAPLVTAPRLGAVGRAAAVGAGEGAVYGFNAGEGGVRDRGKDAAIGLGAGAALAGSVSTVGGKLSNALARRRNPPAQAPSLDDLRQQANAIYQQADEVTGLPRENLTASFDDIQQNALRQGLDPDLTPGADKVLSRLEDAATSPDPNISFRELDTLRKKAQIPAGNLANRTEAAIGSQMVESIDRVVSEASPELGAAIGKARDIWGRMRRTELIENAMAKAQNQASGYENGLRVQFRAILNNPKLRRGFSPEEVTAMERVVQGTAVSNWLKRIGRLGVGAGQQTNALSAVAGYGLIGAFSPVVGTAAQHMGSRATRQGVENVRRLVASGPAAAQPAGRLSRKLIEDTARIGALSSHPINPYLGPSSSRKGR